MKLKFTLVLFWSLFIYDIRSAPSQEEIIEAEKNLNQTIEALVEEGLSDTTYRNFLDELEDLLGKENFKKLLEQGIDSVPEKQKTQVNSILIKMKETHKAFVDLQAEADKFMLMQLDYFLVNSDRILTESITSLDGQIDEKIHADLLKRLQKLKEISAGYYEELNRFGTGKDVIRRNQFLKYFNHAKELVIELQRSINSPTRKYSTLDTTLYVIRKTRHKIRVFAQLIFPAIRTIYVYLFPREKNQFSGFPKQALAVVNRLAEAVNISVNIQGKDKLPKVTGDDKLVTIYTPTHRHPVNDLIIMERIQNQIDETAITYAATRNFAPPAIADRLGSHPAVIPVGSAYGNPTERLLKTLGEESSRSVFLYPEAGIHSGIQNTLPIRDELSRKLLIPLREAGYKVQIVPITYSDAARTLDQTSIFEPSFKGYTLNAKIHEPISSDMVELLYLVDDTAITRYMRAIMMQHLATDENHVLGMLRPHFATMELLKFTAKDCARTLDFLNGRGIKLHQ